MAESPKLPKLDAGTIRKQLLVGWMRVWRNQSSKSSCFIWLFIVPVKMVRFVRGGLSKTFEVEVLGLCDCRLGNPNPRWVGRLAKTLPSWECARKQHEPWPIPSESWTHLIQRPIGPVRHGKYRVGERLLSLVWNHLLTSLRGDVPKLSWRLCMP